MNVKTCELCNSTDKVSTSKADGGMDICRECKTAISGRVRNSRPGATRK
jgi:hypothetical protein